MGSAASSPSGGSLWVQRLIAIVGGVLALSISFVLISGLGANTRDATPSFFSNAAAVPQVYRKALGPTSLLTELVIERTRVTASILVGAKHAQRFVLDRELGYVVARPRFEVEQEDPGEIAFALTTVDFTSLPAVVDEARSQLELPPEAMPLRVVVTRSRGTHTLVWRVDADETRHVLIEKPLE